MTRDNIKAIIFIAILICRISQPLGAAGSSDPFRIKKGWGDLRGFSFSEADIYELRGEWEFYDHAFIVPSGSLKEPSSHSGAATAPSATYREVPDFWPDGPQGYPFSWGTYRARLLLDVSREYALFIPHQDTASRLYIDGDLVASDGIPGVDAGSSVPSRRINRYVWTPLRAEVDIAIHVSNFHHYKGGMHSPIALGSLDAIDGQRERTLIATFLLFGVFLASALFHLGLFLFDRKRSEYLWFAALCFLFALRSLFIGDADIVLFAPGIDWSGISRGGFLLEAALLPVFTIYVQSLFPRTLPKSIFLIVVGSSAAIFACIWLVLPLPFYAKYLHAPLNYAMYGLCALFFLRMLSFGKAARGDTWCFAGAFLLLFILLVSSNRQDLMFSGFKYEVVTASFAVFILSQSVLIGKRSADARRGLETLTGDLERTVRARTAALEESNALLRDRNDEREFLLMALSHEVRSPMTIVKNRLLGMRRRYPDAPGLPLVIGHLDRIFQAMTDMLDLLLLGKRPPSPSGSVPFDPGTALREIADFYEPAIASAGLTLEAPQATGAAIVAEDYLFNRMCGNLIENAVRYAAPGGSVRLSCEADGAEVILRVENPGPPLAPGEEDRVFQPFYRGDLSVPGTGLGLYLVSKMADRTGATVAYERRDGRNSFRITFPRAPSAGGSSPGPRGPQNASRDERPEGGPGESAADPGAGDDELLSGSSVLAIAESPEDRSELIRILRGSARLRTARSLGEGAELLRRGLRPDAVIIACGTDDAELPGAGTIPTLVLVAAAGDREDPGERDDPRILRAARPIRDERLRKDLLILLRANARRGRPEGKSD